MRQLVAGIVLVVLIGACDSSTGEDDPENLRLGAFDVCTQFVKDRLKAESTAEFPDQFEDDEEVTITQDGEEWTVDSQVDAENSFGGTVTTPFSCTVRSMGEGNWRLVDLTLEE